MRAAPRALPPGWLRPRGRLPPPRGPGPARDHGLRGNPRIPAAAWPRREHPAAARPRPVRAPAALRAAAAGLLAARSAPIGPRGEWAPLPEAPARGIRRGIDEHLGDAGLQLLLHRRAHGPRGPAVLRQPRAARRTRPTASRARPPGAERSAHPFTLPELSHPDRALRASTWPRWCATLAVRPGSGAGVKATPATSGTSSSTRSAGQAGSSSGG